MNTINYRFDVSKNKIFVYGKGSLKDFVLIDDNQKEGRWVDIFQIEKFEKVECAQKFLKFLGSFFDFLPGHNSSRHLHQLPSLIWKPRNIFLEELIFYAGSFNPWHLGHDACLKEASNFGIILVMPDNNPWKEATREECPWRFFRDLCLKYQDTPYSFYPGFLGESAKNPTVGWIPKVICSHKTLLMGDDSLLGFSKWHEVDRLVRHVSQILIVPRNEKDAVVFSEMERIQKLYPWLKLIRLSHHEYEGISSTLLRSEK